jgi:predicted house-cleaning noncanonical NTP pyrophosphatase (MazG superfamily)
MSTSSAGSTSSGDSRESGASGGHDRDEAFTRDETLEVLSNQRRRFVVHHLKQRDGEAVGVSDLAERVASWENDKPIEELTHKERKRVRNALRQFHLPKMDDYRFIEYDSRRGTVELSDAAANTNFYVDSLSGGGIAWGVYYLGLSALSAVSLVGLWFEVFPFSLLSPLTWGLFFVTALVASSVGHFYDNYYRMRLGTRDRPTEVDDR